MTVPVKRKRGRPRKDDVSSVKKGSRNAVGRPKGDAAVINEYKARMLASPKSRKVLDTIFDAALDHDHKNQAAAWKLVMDRILPVAAFEKDIVKDGGRKRRRCQTIESNDRCPIPPPCQRPTPNASNPLCYVHVAL